MPTKKQTACIDPLTNGLDSIAVPHIGSKKMSPFRNDTIDKRKRRNQKTIKMHR